MVISGEEKLQALLGELERHASAFARSPLPGREPAGPELVPTIHGMAMNGSASVDAARSVLMDRRLMPRSAATAPDVYRTLSTLGYVFTSLGILYPRRDIALIFHPRSEDGRTVDASPWDSGAFWKGFDPDGDPARRLEVFERYRLPAPQYRRYFARYLSVCFDGLDVYLACRGACSPDPIGYLRHDRAMTRIFEVRHHDGLALIPANLVAIVMPAGLARADEFKEPLAALRRHRVTIATYQSAGRISAQTVTKRLVEASIADSIRKLDA